MQKQEKSRKPLIVGIIAAVVILAVLLVLLLTQCTGGQGDKSSTPATEDTSVASDYQLYWNLDKAEYAGKSEAGLSSRMPEDDGFFYVRFFYEGEVVTFKVADRRTINSIDVQDLMGLEFDENGVVVGVQKLDDLPLEKAGWQFFVQSAAKTIIKLNSSESLNGMEIMLEDVDPNRVWDMSGKSGEPGTVDTPITLDKVMAVQNLEGKTTHVFIYERPNYMNTHKAYCQHCEKEVEWIEWDKETQIPAANGHYQLQNDIVRDGAQIDLPEETQMCLDLNGHRVDGKTNARVYTLRQAAASFALMDTSEAQTGVLACHGKVDQGGVVWPTKGAFYMYGGTLDASDAYTNKSAPAVSVSSGAYFYMYGGKIIGGTAKPIRDAETGKYSGGYAGAIAVMGKFVMYDGIIENGVAKAAVTWKNGTPTYNAGHSGNIYISNGVFEMHGGIIRGGKSDGTGGNIRINGNSAEFTMNGGSIQGGICYGKGQNGGNINIASSKAKFTMNGGSIVGGVSYNAAGNVYCAGEFIMNSGYIGSGALMKFGENKRSTTGTSYNMMFVNGKFTQWGGTVVGGVSIQDTKADGKFQAQLNLYHKAKIHGDETGKNLTISKNGDGVTVNVGTMHKDADIWVNAGGIFTKPTKAENAQYFHSDVAGMEVVHYQDCLAIFGKLSCLCNYGKTVGGKEVTSHTAGCIAAMAAMGLDANKDKLPMSTLSKSNYANMSGGDSWFLADDLTIGDPTKRDAAIIYVADGKTLVLDLNGKTLTLNRDGMAFTTQKSAKADSSCKLIITDTSAEQTGKIKLVGSGTNQGGIVRLWGRTANADKTLYPDGYEYANNDFYLLAGTLDATDYAVGAEGKLSYGGAVEVHHKQDMYMYGGTIIGSQSPYISNGSAVRVNTGFMYMYGGTIYGGKNADIAVVHNSNVFEMYGGTICGGVTSNKNTVKISGTAVINKDLTPAGITVPNYSLQVSSGKTVDFAGLTTGAEVYVTAGGKFGINADASIAALVKSDNPYGKVELDGTDLVMGYADLTYCECGGTLNGKYGHTCQEVVWKAWTSTNSLPVEAGNWYLASDVNMTADVTVPKNVTIRLDLAGKKVNLASGIRMYKFSGNGKSTLVITDTVGGEGVVAVGTAGNGGIMDVSAENTVKIYNVVLDASGRTLTENGGIAAVRAGAHLTTYNVTVKGGYAKGTWDGTSGNKKDAGVYRLFASSGALAAGKLSVYGGTIYGGKATNNGGILYANNSNVVHFEDVTLIGGEAAGAGGAIMLSGNVQMTLKNCTITGAKAASNGGALCVSGSGVKVTISGTTTITANTTADGLNASNIYANSSKLIIADDFTGKISLAGKTGVAIVDNVTALDNKFITGGNIVLDDPSNYRFVLVGGKLGMEELPPQSRMQCVCGGVLKGTDGHTCTDVEFQPWTSTTSLPTTAGNWYLNKNVGLSATATIGADVNIDLNGKTVSNANGAVLNVKSGTVTITDSTATAGTISGGKGGVLKAEGTAVLKLYAGTVTGGKADAGAVQLAGTSKLVVAGAVDISTNTTADGTAASNINAAKGATIEVLPGFTGKIGFGGELDVVIISNITALDDARITNGNVALDDKSGAFKLAASAEGLKITLSDPTTKYACVCGGVLANGKYGHVCNKVIWTAWDKADSLPTAAGNYYLTADSVTLKSAGTVAKDATVRLDLNGKTVNLPDNVQFYKFGADYGSKLVITDTTAAPGSVIAVGGAGNGGFMDINPTNEVEVYNVTLDATQRTTRENGTIAAIRADAFLTTYNATMKGGTAGPNANNEKKDGGCFRIFTPASGTSYEKDGKLTVYGGTVYGGTATNLAGVVYAANNGDVDFTDVKIIGGTSGAGAGAFHITGTTKLDLTNVEIEGTHAGTTGGVINVNGTPVINLNNVTIKDCSAGTYGGVIYAAGTPVITLNSVTIENCSAESYGGTFYLTGNANVSMKNCTIDGCSTKVTAGAIYLTSKAAARLDSVEIKNCSGVNNGGAIRIQSSTSTLTLAGNTRIVENKQKTVTNNIGFNEPGQIILEDSFNGVIGLANSAGAGVIPAITALDDPRVGVNVVLDYSSRDVFHIYESKGVKALGVKAK